MLRSLPLTRKISKCTTLRYLSTSHVLREESSTPATSPNLGTVASPKKPIGGFRGGLIGFLFGFSLASAFAAYHLLDEYKAASAALQTSVEELRTSTEKVSAHVRRIEAVEKDLKALSQSSASKDELARVRAELKKVYDGLHIEFLDLRSHVWGMQQDLHALAKKEATSILVVCPFRRTFSTLEPLHLPTLPFDICTEVRKIMVKFSEHLNRLVCTARNAGGYASHLDADWSQKRKQILLSLVDQLAELSNDGELDTDAMPQSAPEDDLPTASRDVKQQAAGADRFFKFQRQVENLDIELCNFENAARHLGSSVGILSSASKLRKRLTNILFLLRENAACLFPRRVIRHSREVLLNADAMDGERRRAAWRRRRPLPLDDNLQPETLPSHLENFADDVKNFVKCLNEFPEFDDVAVNQSMMEFEGNLRYWAVHLKEYTNQFRSAAVQRYVHDLTSEIGYHVDNVTVTLAMFIEIGVPTISSHQQHAAANLLNLSTVATFFSGVTATTLQFSYSTTGGKLADVVNTLWFSSLVFSIAAAVNSLLGLTWKKAMYRSPGHRVPWTYAFHVFFSSGMSIFLRYFLPVLIHNLQGSVTSTIITVLTVITSFGLAAVSAWFASERWIFVRHSGQKWLGDVIAEFTASVANLRIVRSTRIIIKWCNTCFLSMRAFCWRLSRAIHVSMFRENTVLPLHNQPDQPQPFRHPCPTSSRYTDPQEPRPSFPSHDMAISSSESVAPSVLSDQCSDRNITSGTIDARQRFVNAVRTVMLLGTASRPRSPALEIAELGMSGRAVSGFKWEMLIPLQDHVAHQALVRHLQFSPNGKFLATAGWDKKSVVFRVARSGELTAHRVLFNGRGLIGQVAWSPNGQAILVRLPRAIRVWSEDGVCMRSIVRPQPIQSIAWLPNGEGFLSVEGSDVVRLNLMEGTVLDTYNLGQVQLCGVAVTQDCVRLVGVGPSITPEEGPHPSCHIRVEKRIIVYNMVTKTKEIQTPLADDIRDITMARKTPLAPPQIWRLEIIKDRDRDCTTSRISLKHAFATKAPVESAGSCYFGGCDDQFVVCAGKTGDVHIWDRDSATLLHFIGPQGARGDLTCIGWNRGLTDLKTAMFATGSHGGVVRVWSTYVPVDERDERSLDES
ncbi:hypothetical protein EDC04DRAFT_2904814 [Pisolithus marmoratus]|nr:hypothetical protein EDC04DRAFT_2904814 [Pisolithus marmoratus]